MMGAKPMVLCLFAAATLLLDFTWAQAPIPTPGTNRGPGGGLNRKRTVRRFRNGVVPQSIKTGLDNFFF